MNLFSYNRFKTNKVNNKYYCIHFNDEKKSSYDLSSTNIKIKITFFIEDTILKKVKLQIERGKFKRCR